MIGVKMKRKEGSNMVGKTRLANIFPPGDARGDGNSAPHDSYCLQILELHSVSCSFP